MSTVKQEKIRQHYDAVADTYDNHYDHTRGRCYHAHLSSLLMEGFPEGARVLDIGCGTGLFTDKYTKACSGNAVGLDLSRRMIERARARCPDGDFTVATGEHIPFADGSFDAVASLLVFSYLREPAVMLNEACRVLRPGGSIAVCTLGKKFLTRGIPALYRISETFRIRHVVMKNFGEHYYNAEEMTALFSSAGFTGITVRWCSFAHIDMIDPLFRFARRMEPFVERRIPQLAYNICVTAKKPD